MSELQSGWQLAPERDLVSPENKALLFSKLKLEHLRTHSRSLQAPPVRKLGGVSRGTCVLLSSRKNTHPHLCPCLSSDWLTLDRWGQPGGTSTARSLDTLSYLSTSSVTLDKLHGCQMEIKMPTLQGCRDVQFSWNAKRVQHSMFGFFFFFFCKMATIPNSNIFLLTNSWLKSRAPWKAAQSDCGQFF